MSPTTPPVPDPLPDSMKGGERAIHTTAIPPHEPWVDTGTRSLVDQQAAGRFVASGAVDVETVLALEGELPGEQEISARAEMEVADVDKRRLDAFRTGLANVFWARRGELTQAVGRFGGSLVYAGQRLADAVEELPQLVERGKQAAAKAEQAVAQAAAAHGEALAALGRSAPVRATRQSIARIVQRWWWWRLWLPTALAGLVELAATTETIYVLMRTDTHLSALPFALVAVFALAGGPLLSGLAFSALRAAGRLGWRTGLPAAAPLLFWLGSGLGLAAARVSVDQQLAARDAAEAAAQLARGTEQLGLESAAPVASTAADPALTMLLWSIVLLGMGAVLFVKELFFHEAAEHRLAELVAREELWRAEDELARVEEETEAQRRAALEERAGWSDRVDGVSHQIELQEDDILITDQLYRREPEKTRLRAEYEKAAYRTEFDIAAADPETTSALNAQVAARPAPKLRASDYADVELPRTRSEGRWAPAEAQHGFDLDRIYLSEDRKSGI